MRAPTVIWEVAYQADRRGLHHRCRCCNRVLKDGESALMVRVGWKKTYAIHQECGEKPHGSSAWTCRDAFVHWGAEYQQCKAFPMSMQVGNQQQAEA